jgi:hypothetical protein
MSRIPFLSAAAIAQEVFLHGGLPKFNWIPGMGFRNVQAQRSRICRAFLRRAARIAVDEMPGASPAVR